VIVFSASGSKLLTLEHGSTFVTSLGWSPDSQTIASGGADNTVKLWNARDGQFIRALPGHSDWVDAVAFSPDGTRLAVGTGTTRAGGTVSLYGLQTDEAAFGTLPQTTSAADPASNGATRFSIPNDWLASKNLVGMKLRLAPTFKEVGLEGDRLRVSGSQANLNYYLRAVKLPGFSPMRSSLLELGLERARLECVFQTRTDACGDPINVETVSMPTGLTGYEITMSSLTKRSAATNALDAKPHRPILALDVRAYSSEAVLLLAWVEPAKAGEEVTNASTLLREFASNIAFETASN
jgi:WD40 repeat protein